MATFRKMKLVSEDELDRIKQRQIEQYDPKLRIMARVQNQLENLLNTSDESLTANERLRLLEMLQQRFRDMKKVSTAAPPPKAAEEEEYVQPEDIPAAVVEADVQMEREQIISPSGSLVERTLSAPNLNETIISTISTRKQKEARALLDEIAKSPNILNYNERLEAIVNGVPIPGSNFIRLFNSIFSAKAKPASLVGFTEFQNALSNIELSKMSSSSASASSPIASRTRTTLSSSTSSRNPPPGTRPSVLRVYDND